MAQKPNHAIYSASKKGVVYQPGNFHRKTQGEPAVSVVTYQPLGNVWVAIEWLMEKLGVLTLASLKRQLSVKPLARKPDGISEQTKLTGAKYSPEQICSPYKAILGYLIECFEEFARLEHPGLRILVLSHESSGFCRERNYARLQEAGLGELFEGFDFYIIHESRLGLLRFMRFLGQISGKNLWQVWRAFTEAIKRLKQVEQLERKVRYFQSLVRNYYEAENILIRIREQASDPVVSFGRLKDLVKEAEQALSKIPKAREKPIADILLTGEIFQMEEQESSSENIVKELAGRGFFPVKEVGIGHYLDRFDVSIGGLLWSFLKNRNPFKRNKERELAKAGGLRHDSGGHSVETIALFERILKSRSRGNQPPCGVVVMESFPCLPQIVSANLIPHLMGRYKDRLPWLRLIFSDQTGRAGIITRIEAFTDLI